MLKSLLSTCVALALTGCANLTPPAKKIDLVENWQQHSPMQFARAAHAVVANENAIFAIAGTGALGKPVLQVERFDGKQWQLETTLPAEGLNAPAAALIGDNIYLIGGFGSTSNVPVAKVWAYQLSSKTWQARKDLPTPRGGHSAVVLNGKIHVFGGGNESSTIANHSVYDPTSDTWQEFTPLPRREGSPAVAAHLGKIYVIGGRSGDIDFGEVYIYDPVSNSWNFGPALTPRGTAGAVNYCDTVYIFGGESQKEKRSLATVERLAPQRNKWLESKAMPSPRNFARAVNFNNAVYVVGGSPLPGSSHESRGSALVESFVSNCVN
jgi:N-acetylneuraminic acid mutarotase